MGGTENPHWGQPSGLRRATDPLATTAGRVGLSGREVLWARGVVGGNTDLKQIFIRSQDSYMYMSLTQPTGTVSYALLKAHAVCYPWSRLGELSRCRHFSWSTR